MSGDAWTIEEVEALEVQYNLHTLSNIRIPGRSLSAIRKKIERQMFTKKKTIDKYLELTEKHPKKRTRFYARMLGVSNRTVERYARKLKLMNHESE